MKYTALIYDDCKDIEDSYEHLKKAMEIFTEDDECQQIVVSCKDEWLCQLAQNPISKMMLVKMAGSPYVALLNGLKAVYQENVIVVGLSSNCENIQVEAVKNELSQYPAIYFDKDLQGFDTRLLMFTLQMAIEINLSIDSYAQAVEKLGDTPLKYIGTAVNQS